LSVGWLGQMELHLGATEKEELKVFFSATIDGEAGYGGEHLTCRTSTASEIGVRPISVDNSRRTAHFFPVDVGRIGMAGLVKSKHFSPWSVVM